MWASSKSSRWEILQDGVDTPVASRRPSKENGDNDDATAVPSPNQQQKSKRRRRKNKKKNKKVLSTDIEPSNAHAKMAAVSAPSGLALKDLNAGNAKSTHANLTKDDQSKTTVDDAATRETTKPSTSPSAIIPSFRQDLYIHPTTEKYLTTIKHRPGSDANHNLPSLDRLVEEASRIECELIEEIRSIQTTLGVNEGQMASPIRSENGGADQADLPSSFECDRDSASLVSEIPFDLQSTAVRVLTTVTGSIVNMSPEDEAVDDMLHDVERIVSELNFSPVAVDDNTSTQRTERNANGGWTTTNLKIAVTLYFLVAISSSLMAHLPRQVIMVDAHGQGGADTRDAEVWQRIEPSRFDREAYYVQRKGLDSSIRDEIAPADSSDNASINADDIEKKSEKYQVNMFRQDGPEQENITGESFTSWPIDKRGLDFLDKPSDIDVNRKGLDFLHEDDSIEAPNDVVQWIEARQNGSACFQPVGVLSPNFEVALRGSGCAIDLEGVLREYNCDSGAEIEAEVETPSNGSDDILHRLPYRPGIVLRPSFLPSDSSTMFTEETSHGLSQDTTFSQRRMLWDARIYAKAKALSNSSIVNDKTRRMLRSLAATHVREQLSYLAKQPKRTKIELAVPKLALLEAEQ